MVPDESSGRRMAEHLHQNVHQPRVGAWCYWQCWDCVGCGVLQADLAFSAVNTACLPSHRHV